MGTPPRGIPRLLRCRPRYWTKESVTTTSRRFFLQHRCAPLLSTSTPPQHPPRPCPFLRSTSRRRAPTGWSWGQTARSTCSPLRSTSRSGCCSAVLRQCYSHPLLVVLRVVCIGVEKDCLVGCITPRLFPPSPNSILLFMLIPLFCSILCLSRW